MSGKYKKGLSLLFSLVFWVSVIGSVPASAEAATVTYTSPLHTFSINDVIGDYTGNYRGTDCLDLSKPMKDPSGVTYYQIDSIFGYDVKDFEEPVQRTLDGYHREGFIGNITDDDGNVIGVSAKSPATPKRKTGALQGEWLGGLGGQLVKASTEHYVVMDHILNAPWMPPLVEGVDYTTSLKDDGKILYKWGNYSKDPFEIRLYTAMPLPEDWKVPGANYVVKSAKLVINHNISNSPNDQLRPEDFENEDATGILPQYTVAEDGSWLSAVDSTEGDGDFIPAGTVLRDASGEFTNAWYTTLDRDPFGGDNPRWRLKSSKYGQDLPGVELPQYQAGQPTTTTINLLAAAPGEVSPLAESKNWNNYLDYDPLKPSTVGDNISAEGCPLTPDFDLMIYCKGEYKGTQIYSARLIIEYEDPNATDEEPAAGNDLTLHSLTVPEKVKINETSDIEVAVKNNNVGEATGTLTLIGKDKKGSEVARFSTDITTPADTTSKTYRFSWKAPDYQTQIQWTATVTADEDKDITNNTQNGSTRVGKGK